MPVSGPPIPSSQPGHREGSVALSDGAGGVIEVDRNVFAVDPDPGAFDQPPELTWYSALTEPVIQYRDGQNHRLSRQSTHERITLLQAESARLETLLPDLLPQLGDATREVEANAARLETARAAMDELIDEGERQDQQVVDFAAPKRAAPYIKMRFVMSDAYLTRRGTTLSQTRAWLAHAELKHRTFNDPRSAEFQAIRRKSRLEDQISGIPRWIAELNTKVHELHENLRILDEQDERSDPNSAWSIARRQRIERLEADVRAGRILGYQIVN